MNKTLARVTRNMSLFKIEADQYEKGSLDAEQLQNTPGLQFRKWFEEARAEGIAVPEAMNVATAELPSGRVSNRNVLLKDFDAKDRIVFYSNWDSSRKAADYKTNDWFSVCFYWKELQRQVRIEGKGTRLSPSESQEYFDSRPRESRIGAWASPQSQPLANREEFEELVKKIEERFEGVEQIPCPPFWTGMRIEPIHWEFWQGRRGRLHDRFYYDLVEGSSALTEPESWKVTRTAP